MEISKIDLDSAIESIKNGKSSVSGGMLVKIIKFGGYRLRERIWNLIDRVLCC
jgi:hypothetical protein